jgi:3-deoxy-manno-octulosonate cytidylyltransferase (CMP-KDO synthetase)
VHTLFRIWQKKIKMVETHVEGVEIDTPEDLERAKRLWK